MRRSAWLRASLAGGLVGLVACTTPATSVPTSSPMVDAVGSAETTEAPITYPADNMWGLLSTSAGTGSGAANVTDAARLADVVVVGRWVGLERGDGVADSGAEPGWYAIADIEIEGTEKGTAMVGSDGYLHVPFLLVLGGAQYPDKEFADLQRSIPTDPALLFLISWDHYFARAGGDVPVWLEGLNRADIYRTIGADGAIRLVAGKLDAPPFDESWLTSIDGLSLDEVRAGL